MTVIAAVVATGSAPAVAASDDNAGGASSNRPGPGAVERVDALPPQRLLAGAGRGYAVWYGSTTWDGKPTTVSGTLYVPAGNPPRDGWPVVTFGHALTGAADQCAPSRTGPTPWEGGLQSAWLSAGFAVAATDFEGLGTPGEYPVTSGNAAAYAMIDAVRASRRVDHTVGRSWISAGFSLGGLDALFAGARASSYAPELRLRGTIALAPVTQWRLTLSAPGSDQPSGPANPFLPYFVSGAQVTHPDTYRPEERLTPTGLRLLDLARNGGCLLDVAMAMHGLTNGDVFLDSVASTKEAVRLLSREEVPVIRYSRPVFIVHGTADTSVPAEFSQVTADQLAGAGTCVTYRPIEGADHYSVFQDATPLILEESRRLVQR